MTTNIIREIPLSKLVPSDRNVRRTGRETGIEELAASIAAHGLLQSLSVRPVLDADGAETDKYRVSGGGRRLAALKLLAKRKQIAKTYPVPSIVNEGNEEEVSLAENIIRENLHPADQYEAFARLQDEQAMTADDIAARFGFTTAAVKQRMKLGAVSPKLMQLYRDGEMNLEQLMAFTITDDHARQERVWSELSWNKGRDAIRKLLTEGQVPATDRRAMFVGIEAYEAAGGVIVRDLFDEAHGGFFSDAELLDRLVREKLETAAREVETEGWKWVQAAPEFNYSLSAGLRRVYPETIPPTDEEQARFDALEAEYEALSVQHDGEEATSELEAEFDRLESEIDGLRGRETYAADDIARAGVFVALGYDGKIRIERGFVRPEDEPPVESGPEAEGEAAAELSGEAGTGDDPETGTYASTEEDEPDGLSPLSDKLVEDLTYHRTAALQDQLADQPGVAVSVIAHALALREFYGAGYNPYTCLKIESSPVVFGNGVADGKAAQAVAQRHDGWARRLPRDSGDLWGWIKDQDGDAVLSLLAFCVARTVYAVKAPWSHEPKRLAQADDLAARLALDMTGYWSPTVNKYLGRVTKARIIEAVREGVSEEAAERIAGMKKQPMAEAAEQLLVASAWLPPLLRTPEAVQPALEDQTETAPGETYPQAAE
jgi:ParB family chromosome partitioning protein